jgi:polyribonucleotide nucleotidyltransferase
LEKMLAVLPQPRTNLSVFAPKIVTLKIPVDKIGELIGPSGKNIKNIIATTGAQVDVEDDGTVSITGTDDTGVQSAYDWISGMTREVTVGEEFDGEVKRILPFGAFVEFLPGKEGMVHVSKMSTQFVNNPTDVVQIGQQVHVRVMEIDDQGRVNLTMLTPEEEQQAKQSRGGDRPSNDFNRPTGGFNRDRSDHPLSRQFQREQRGSRPGFGRNNSRPGGRPGYKKYDK